MILLVGTVVLLNQYLQYIYPWAEQYAVVRGETENRDPFFNES